MLAMRNTSTCRSVDGGVSRTVIFSGIVFHTY